MNLSQQITNVSLRNRLTEPYFLIIASLLCINVAIFHPPAVHFKSQTISSVCQVVLKTSFWKRLQDCRELPVPPLRQFSAPMTHCQAGLGLTTCYMSRKWTQSTLELKFCPIHDFPIRSTPCTETASRVTGIQDRMPITQMFCW